MMRILIIIMTAGCMQVAAKGYAQLVTLHARNQPLTEVFTEVKNQTGYVFIWNEESLLQNRVSLNVNDASLEETLDLLFKGLPYTYTIINKSVIVKEKEEAIANRFVAYFRDAEEIRQQQLIIRGTVSDSTGNPLKGASITIKGASVKVTTNSRGEFSIVIPKAGVSLVISYLGMQTREIQLNDPNQVLSIVLKTDEVALQDVVVTGYSNVRKESFTGNAVKVTQEDLLKVSNRNVIQTLQVFDPSFRLERNNMMGSDPNTLPQFYVRGRSGIGVKELDDVDISEAALTNNPNLPIFIMDGFQVSAEKIYDYDPNRIKSITILKDAAATAIYGSRAANGVVVIETVPPKAGKIRANYNFVSSLTLPDLSDYNLMNAQEKLDAEVLGGFYNTEGQTPSNIASLTNEYISKNNQLLKGVNTDWISQPLTNEFNQKHTLYIDGGISDIRFGFLMRYDKQNGVMKESGRERLGTGLTFEYHMKNVEFRNDLTYDIVNATNSPYGDFSDYTWKSPYDQMRDATGALVKNTTVWHSGGTDQLNLVNPLYEVMNTQNSSTSGYNSLTNNLSINWYIIPQLQLKGQLAVTKQDNNSRNFIDPNSGRYLINVNTDYTTIGELTLGNSNNLNWSTNLFANYVNSIKGHNINVSAGINTNEVKTNGSTMVYTGFPSGSQSSPNFASKMTNKPAYSDNNTRLFGSFATLNYSYNDIYLLDVSSRIDGSSEFGTEKKYAPFWSTGVGLNLHKYHFLANHPLISRLRVTGSMGQLGKVNFQPYAAQDNYVISQGWYRTGAGASLIYMGNPELRWEKTSTYDAVLDIGLLKDRVTINVDLYNKITNDLVNDVDLPLSSGFNLYKGNIGKIQNKGIEIFLRGDVVHTKDAIIGLYINFASNTNKLLNISNSLKAYNDKVNALYANYTQYTGNNPTYATQFSTPHTKYIEGGSLTSIFGMKSLGINPMDGKEIYQRPDGSITYDWNASDQVVIGDTSPKGQGAFGVNANYKGFTFFASFLYQYGAQEYNNTLLAKVENVDLYNRNTDKRVLTQRWQKPGDVTTLKDIKDLSYATRPTSRFIQDYNAITLNSISIGYNLNPQWLKKWKASMLRIQCSTNDLATLSTVRQERGLSYPFARTFDLSVNLGF